MRSSKISNVITVDQNGEQKGKRAERADSGRDFYWSLYPVLFFYHALSLRKIFSADGKLSSAGVFVKAYSALICLAMVACEVYVFTVRFDIYLKYGYEKAVIDLIILTPSMLAPICAVLISAFFTSKAMPKFMANVDMMDNELAINKAKSYATLRLYTILAHAFYLSTVALVAFYDWYIGVMTESLIFWHVHQLILDLTMIEFILYTNVIRLRLAGINEKLEAICDDIGDYSSPSVYSISANSINNCFSWADPKAKKLSPKFLKKKFEAYYIVQLMTIYDKIADNTYILHNCYGVPLFLISITSFANLLSVFNNYLLFFKGHDPYSLRLWNSFVWGIKCFWLTTFGAFMCSALQNKTSITTNTLDKLAIHPSSDESQKRLVERFSCLVRCRTLKITACNFFTYDASFIASLVGAFISYSIILMQNDTSHSSH